MELQGGSRENEGNPNSFRGFPKGKLDFELTLMTSPLLHDLRRSWLLKPIFSGFSRKGFIEESELVLSTTSPRDLRLYVLPEVRQWSQRVNKSP